MTVEASTVPAQSAPMVPWSDVVKQKLPYYQKRVELFTQYRAREVEAVEAAKQANVPIKLVLPDGSERPGVKGVTTPMDIANQLSKSLAKKAVVAKADGASWDMLRPLQGDCALQILTFDDADGKEVRCAVLHTIPAAYWRPVLALMGAPLLICRPSGTQARTSWAKPWSSNTART